MPGATPYVLVEERSVGGKQSKGKRIFRLALSIFTMVLCGLLFVHAILSLIATHTHPFSYPLEYGAKWGVDFRSASANFTVRVFSAYLLVISFLFLCVELKSTVVLTFFAGMISPLGRGIVYFINGLLVFGLVGNWGLVFGFLWMVCGVLHIALGARSCRTFYEEGTVDTGSATVTHGLHPHNATHTLTKLTVSLHSHHRVRAHHDVGVVWRREELLPQLRCRAPSGRRVLPRLLGGRLSTAPSSKGKPWRALSAPQ